MKKLNVVLSLTAVAVITSITAVFAFGVASPKDVKLTIVNPSAKTSPATVFGKAVQNTLGEKASFYQAANCEDAVRKYNETENSVYIYNSSIEFAARNKGLNCLLKEERNKSIVWVGKTPMHICRLPGTSNNFGKEPMVLGMASMYATKEHEDKFKEAGANVKIVPFSGSKSVLAALYAKDINLGWMGSGLAIKQKDKLECLYSTDGDAENFLGKTWNNGVPNFTITYVVYTNAEGKALEKIKSNLADNPNFIAFLNKSNTKGNEVDNVQEAEDQVVAYVDTLFNTWASKK